MQFNGSAMLSAIWQGRITSNVPVQHPSGQSLMARSAAYGPLALHSDMPHSMNPVHIIPPMGMAGLSATGFDSGTGPTWNTDTLPTAPAGTTAFTDQDTGNVTYVNTQTGYIVAAASLQADGSYVMTNYAGMATLPGVTGPGTGVAGLSTTSLLLLAVAAWFLLS
jgi:hypothetical protein